MSEGKKSLKDILNSRNIKQIIIPEIQRDYVWKTENVEKLLKSIVADAKESDPGITKEELDKLPPALRDQVERSLEENKIFSNIGFIYAYEDSEYKSRYFLIDGQQRLTTLYLLLLATAINSGKENYFSTHYFNNTLPKLDYKVRESAHNFLVNFMTYLLGGGDIKNIESQYWYFSNYKNDRTISSILRNYKTIASFVKDEKLSVDYVENNIELWFFDISKSSQGEELYIYMNSRGEEVIANENIKASLLENCSDKEKHEWGVKWEDWQDFFWKNRGAKLNSDQGFNEFLKWVIIIEKIKTSPNSSAEELGKFILAIRDQQKFSSELLTVNKIDEYFETIKYLKDLGLIGKKWLTGDTSTIDYFRLFPAILYINKLDAQEVHLRRLLRFFANVSKSVDISKNPDTQVVNAIRLMLKFLDDAHVDVTGFLQYKQSTNYKAILSSEECYKLSLYGEPPLETSRDDLETLFWGAEDSKLLNGKIEFLLFVSGSPVLGSLEKFNLRKFTTIYESFKDLFNKPTDELRRALLTVGDYTIDVGYSTNLSSARYSFGDGIEEWRKIINNHDNKLRFKKFFESYISVSCDNESSKVDSLNNIITSFLSRETLPNYWYVPFIENEKLLPYCENKKVCYQGNNPDTIYLIKKKKATKYEKLSSFQGVSC
ncbi:hypothetical protein LNTAR_15067 [Lentisphaera araneosa HTCC2155]|uniref:GmrSD restriction endonucleases N-terminal domain-containing protein n=1 Tax=Lentisphaera araneosa HTCC2155 TaxID=313628 RepID=A6DRD8_9BACT|nr:DUF262 domain-containing protein [Lentisphaera araneosa]EDM25748.1 hypothetical protein LNTAR_15067 [Lentisphaera araneosa HTCC2155]